MAYLESHLHRILDVVCAKSEYATLGSATDAQFLEQIFGETCSNNMLGHLVAHIQAKMASQQQQQVAINSSAFIISASQLNEINSPFNVSQSFPVSQFMPADCTL